MSADAGAAGALSKSGNSRVQNPGSVDRTASQVLAPAPVLSVSVCVEWTNPGTSEAGTAPKGSWQEASCSRFAGQLEGVEVLGVT